MDLCQAVHEGMLAQAGCLRDDEALHYSRPPPAGSTWEGAYADDHVVIQKLSRSAFKAETPLRDTDIVRDSVGSYLRNGATMSVDKCVRFRETATVWGTQVRGARGLVGSALERRHQIAQLVFDIVACGLIDVRTLDCLLGAFPHPFGHRPELMCVFHRV